MMTALEAGAEDFSADDEVYEITTDPSDFFISKRKIRRARI